MLPVDEETQDLLRSAGRAVADQLDAERALNDGDRLFAFHEQDDEPMEVTSLEQLAAYASDQLVILEAKGQDEVQRRRDALRGG